MSPEASSGLDSAKSLRRDKLLQKLSAIYDANFKEKNPHYLFSGGFCFYNSS